MQLELSCTKSGLFETVRLTLLKKVRQFNGGGHLFSETYNPQQIPRAGKFSRVKWGGVRGRVQEIQSLQKTLKEADTGRKLSLLWRSLSPAWPESGKEGCGVRSGGRDAIKRQTFFLYSLPFSPFSSFASREIPGLLVLHSLEDRGKILPSQPYGEYRAHSTGEGQLWCKCTMKEDTRRLRAISRIQKLKTKRQSFVSVHQQTFNKCIQYRLL